MQEAIERVEAGFDELRAGLEELVKAAAAEGLMDKVRRYANLHEWAKDCRENFREFAGSVKISVPAPETQPEVASAPVLEGPG